MLYTALPNLQLSSATFENGSPVVNEGVPVDALARLHIRSRVDHCYGVLYGSNGYLLDRPELGCEAAS